MLRLPEHMVHLVQVFGDAPRQLRNIIAHGSGISLITAGCLISIRPKDIASAAPMPSYEFNFVQWKGSMR